MTRDEKKIFMEQYMVLSQELDWKLEELRMWREKTEKSEMGNRLLKKLSEETDRRAWELYLLRTQIEKGIENLTDPRLRMLLRLRYLQGLRWVEISRRMNYDTRWLRRLHTRALEAICLPMAENDIKPK